MKDKSLPLKILNTHSLRQTAGRVQLLEVFLKEGSALTHSQLEEICEGSTDRVTIYRTLTTFTEKGILTKIPAIDGATQYLLNYNKKAEIKNASQSHQHLHFTCKSCENTFCLEEYHINLPPLPESFQLDHLSLVGEGVCANCNKKK